MDREQERAIEWECQKVWRRHYYHVDRLEYEEAIDLFTPDVDWESHGIKLDGRDEHVNSLHGSFDGRTIRHVLTNMVITVIDEDHAVARAYNTLYYTGEAEFAKADGLLAFEGPHRLIDCYAELRRTPEGWRISKRRDLIVYRRDPNELVPFEVWGKQEGKLATHT